MSKNTINIDGKKLKSIIENGLDISIYEIATDNGYSRNLVAQAIRTGKASPVVQTLLRLYGVLPEDYEIKDPEPPTNDRKQLSIDDYNCWDRESLKALIKEALIEVLKEINK